jgi:hypothetical protein
MMEMRLQEERAAWEVVLEIFAEEIAIEDVLNIAQEEE